MTCIVTRMFAGAWEEMYTHFSFLGFRRIILSIPLCWSWETLASNLDVIRLL